MLPGPLKGLIQEAGRILGDDFFYQLEAMDKDGTVWHVERTLPTPHTSFVSGRQFRLATGVAPELVTTRAQAAKRVGLEFVERRRASWDHRKLGGVY